jgi:hypothetical protein
VHDSQYSPLHLHPAPLVDLVARRHRNLPLDSQLGQRADDKVPDLLQLGVVDVQQVARLGLAQSALAPGELPKEGLLDEEVRLREDPQLRAERRLARREQLQRRR